MRVDPREQILALVSGLPSAKRNRVLVMLQGFFDGSTSAGQALVVAGFVSNVDSWLAFSDEWAQLLTLKPPMDAFKMSYVAAGGPAMMERAMFHYRVLERFPLIGIGCAIPIPALNKVVEEMKLPAALANPYYLAWRSMVTLALEARRQLRLRQPIEFIFDEQSEQANVLAAWGYFAASMPTRWRKIIAGPPNFKRDGCVMPLQAADMLAWWLREQYLAGRRSLTDIFPTDWTEGRPPLRIYSAHMPERSIREQFSRDLARADRLRHQKAASVKFRNVRYPFWPEEP